MSRRSAYERAMARLLSELGHHSNDICRALSLLDVVAYDRDGGCMLIDLQDEHILSIVARARGIATRLRSLEAEEEQRSLRVVRGGRA